jgi:hypothetical protein
LAYSSWYANLLWTEQLLNSAQSQYQPIADEKALTYACQYAERIIKGDTSGFSLLFPEAFVSPLELDTEDFVC